VTSSAPIDNSDPWSAGFEPPLGLETPRVLLEPLSEQHAEVDFAALMSSREHLASTLHWGSWPRADFTVEENRTDLARHAREFRSREAYAYTVLTPDRQRCLGCLYIEPRDSVPEEARQAAGPVALAAYWVIETELERDLDKHLLQAVLDWFVREWSFVSVAFPTHVQNERGLAIALELGLESAEPLEASQRLLLWRAPG
jgi:RimJ/RimL family protein N-acetyltransferase